MSSWFSSAASLATSTLNVVSESVSSSTAAQEVLESVVSSASSVGGTLQKLTLSTPEMQAERQAMLEMETKRARVKDLLSHLYPWQTRDEERDILVEECKQAILALTSNPHEVFFGPHAMPRLNVNTMSNSDDEKEEDEINVNDDEQGDNNEQAKPPVLEAEPSSTSLEKLAKLEPLPPLLKDFDLDAHVGLIHKMLQADPKLVECQSIYSGGGERERTFWRNYFFHCAYTRYEAGLSIDEIWSDQPPIAPDDASSSQEASASASGEQAETTITFESASEPTAPTTTTTNNNNDNENNDKSTLFNNFEPPQQSGGSTPPDYEVVGLSEDDFGGELDELEAEIARELED